jgi:hypothetical protein
MIADDFHNGIVAAHILVVRLCHRAVAESKNGAQNDAAWQQMGKHENPHKSKRRWPVRQASIGVTSANVGWVERSETHHYNFKNSRTTA